MAASKTELSPPPRSSSLVASTEDKLYLWGGYKDAKPKAVHIYNVVSMVLWEWAWMREITEGSHPPAGLFRGGCSVSGLHIYLYGGRHGLFLSGSLYKMNTDNWSWSELSNCSAGGPVRKSGCRMITYKDQLVVVGGCYKDLDCKQPGSTYEEGWTNELHCYSLTIGKCEASLCEHVY